ncbi:MAG: 7,8-didemethyl-8-hydroxy-5-deazariboflavin synthase CofG [Microbacterium sp.]
MTPVTAPAPTLSDALRRAEDGTRLSADDAEILLSATGAERVQVLAAAAAIRDAGLTTAGRAGIITYSRKVFIPLTTLCRDRCHYCVFVDTPNQLLRKHKPAYMSPEQVLAVARAGQAMGCKEALLTLGDRPEDRWPEARAWLDEHGYMSTLEYVGAMATLITDETGLLPHLNPGVMSPHELGSLRPVAPSMGVMLETTSRALFTEKGQVHYGSPDKDPAVRLELLENAGRARIPFTSGILVGIGETMRDRAESMVALREVHERYGHVQEVIVQNFRAKPRTAMQDAADADTDEYVLTVAVARLVMGPDMRIQVPPNLSDPREFASLIGAGIDDWGGVSPLTADHVNPERPWPHLDDLAEATADLGFTLRERLTAHPRYVQDDGWIDPAIRPATLALAGEDGLARVDRKVGFVSPVGRAPSRETAPDVGDLQVTMSAPGGLIAAVIERAAQDPASLDDAEWERLLLATGDELEALVRTADDVRRYTVGEAITIVANRNVASSGFRAAGCEGDDTYDLALLAEIARDAANLGLTEICVQGLVAPSESPDAYLDIARTISYAASGMHLHAYRPQDICDFTDRSGLGLDDALSALREAGVDTVPGTGVKVLSERVRRLVAPDDLEIGRWIETITAAHLAGFRSTSVLFYGHVETAAERIAHLRQLLAIQKRTGGFREFVPIPLPGSQLPLDEHRAVVAVSRLMLSGAIPHIQIPWTRHGLAVTAELLQAGGDDLGGTLLDGRVAPHAGVEAGHELPLDHARALANRLFRPFRQRTTDYGDAP